MATSDAAAVRAAPACDDERSWGEIARNWSFAPGITFLNHGSFGAAPRQVLEVRKQWLAQLNRDPVHFFFRVLQPQLAAARARLGEFLNTSADNLALVENTTVAMNAVARSVPLSPGDEVLTTDHEYGAVMRIWQLTCERAGARLVVARLPCPLGDADACVGAIESQATARTKLLVFSHVTSPTAAILPAAAVCRRAHELGIPVCIDGPHALVATPLDLAALDCDYYTASCHKWLLTPVGAGMLYVHPRAQAHVKPAVISWGRTLGYEQAPSWRDEFNWSGTRDPTPCLCIPAALEFLESLGVEAFRARTHYLARLARDKIVAISCLAPLVPDDAAWYGSMIALPVLGGDAPRLQEALWEKYQIEVPVFGWEKYTLVRVSCQVYTQPADIDRLATAIRQLLPPADASREKHP
jgi:isopenicillin-N epimerase